MVDVGEAVQGFEVGDRVISNGSHAEMVCVSCNLCAKIPDGVGDEAAGFAVLGAIGLQGIRLLMMTEPLDDLSRLLQASDLFVRPTNTDGDANSIRGALRLGTPVVTSDVVRRPEQCVLFHTRDMDDFERVVRRALGELPALRERVSCCRMDDHAAQILDLYARLKGEQR